MSIILCNVYRWFRETILLNTTILLGGPGKIVKVDESLFWRKPKVILNLIIILHFQNYIIFSTMLVATCIGNLGLRHGRHLPVTSTGVHADCARQNSCHSPPYSATACCPRICRPFRPVGQLQPGGQSSKCICPWNSQSLHGICEPIWSPHTEQSPTGITQI